MYNMHKELNEFYEEHVRLKGERNKLKEHRDTNLAALKDGLKNLEYPSGFDKKDQGSYAMNTINKHPKKEYDIDVAIIFEKDDLPSDPMDARKRIEEAMIEGGGNFKTPPEAKTNAVRVSYAEGHHIDLAIYRKYTDAFGNETTEHAGSEWTVRDPIEITNWFISTIDTKSPSKEFGATVDDKQMRRIVRWIKMFAKSRESWNLPGGLILSVLVNECYQSNLSRDDVSLYDTMVSIRDRVRWDQEVLNPVDSNQSLTSREKDKTRIKNLEEKLDFVLEKMDVLFEINCAPSKALQAWNWVFDHHYWEEKMEEESKSGTNAKKDGPIVINTTGPWWRE